MSCGPRHTERGEERPLVGRAFELAELEALAAQVRAGRSRVVQIEGPAGIGKSALLNGWCRRDRRFRVLWARCRPLEREFAFGAVRQLFRPVMEALTEADRAALPEGTEAAARRVLEDGARTEPPAAGPHPGATALDGLDALALHLSARRPLLLAIDNLQWIDTPSLRWLARLVTRADTRPLLVAVVNRTGEFRKPDPLFAELVRPDHCHRLALEPLDVPGVRHLARHVWQAQEPDAAFAAACHAATGGHPLFLWGLLHHAELAGVRPTAEYRDRLRTVTLSTLDQEIRRRLSQGSREVVELTHALAVLGDRKPAELLAAYCGSGEAVVRAAADDLWSLGLLRSGGEPCFLHQVVRDTVLATMSPEERGQGHARAAQVSHLAGRPDEEVAAHLLAAGPVEGSWAVPVLRRAADEALHRGAPDVAVTYLRSALGRQPGAAERGPLLLQLGVAAGHYDADLALSYVTGALEVLTEKNARRDALGVLTYCLQFSRRPRGALSGVDRLIAELCGETEHGGGADRELVLRMRALRSWREYERSADRSPEPSAPVSVEGLVGRTPGERQLLALHAFHSLKAAVPAPYVTELVDRACVNLPVFSHDLFPLHYFVAQTLFYLDELDRVDRFIGQLTQGAENKGLELLDSSLSVLQAALAWQGGNVTEALGTAQAAAGRRPAAGTRPYATTLDIIRINALLEQGQLDAAEQVVLTRSPEEPQEAGWERPLFLLSLSALRMSQGEPRTALALLRECGHHLDAAGTVNPAICPWRSRAAAAHLALGERPAAHALIEQELDLARQSRIPRALGVALRAAGLAAQGARGPELLGEAVHVLTATPARLDLARTLGDLGVALLRRDERSGARDALQRGLELATACGATALAGRLRDPLHEAGGRAARPGGSLLTPGEERVSTLAVQGHSNKQIAELLVVSLRTVETHLTGAYRKLGIAGRHHLAAALAGPGAQASSRRTSSR
ncbi:ATP-binding protein [Streptomyces kronopolitis]|uniref:ATP-binding protein n=1 Tax=Streptomyces kronopolitis TaxID=1612435 RepID=UPI003D96D4F0